MSRRVVPGCVMGQAAVENGTPFAFEALFLADEEGRPLLVPVVKATYDIAGLTVALAEEQQPVNPAGEPYGDPAISSYRYEPECAFVKVATDVVLVGSACAPRRGTTEMLVAFQVGALRKAARVVGDRVFYKALGRIGMTKPVPFERIPLQWERAFGGWDRSDPDEKKHRVELRNPVGLGFRAKATRFEPGLRCPNLEDPAAPFKGWGDHATPVGFGFVSPNWQPRAQYAGTYDEAWQRDRAPLLPKDFDRRFMNAGAPGLIAQGYLRGDEPVVATGVTAAGGISFRLPGVAPPQVLVEQTDGSAETVATNLDTVIVDSDASKLFLLWRGMARVREPTSVRTLRIGAKEDRWAASA